MSPSQGVVLLIVVMTSGYGSTITGVLNPGFVAQPQKSTIDTIEISTGF